MPDHPDQTSLTDNAAVDLPRQQPDHGSSPTVNLRNPVSVEPAVTPGPAGTRDGLAPESRNLLGDYELLAEIGRGGMGIVYKARHRTLNRIVALKVTYPGQLVSAEVFQRFQIEAAAVARLDHPNIVPVYEIGEAYGQQFFSMAFIDGESLGHAVARSPLPPRRAAELIQQVAAAIAYAHTQGVIHRDLKPENILVDASGRPRVTDFGIARCADVDSRLTRAGDVMGTPSYMPPEQTQEGMAEVGPLADVYSLGATLYCLLTGRPPFQAATTLETFKQVVEREPVAPRHLNPAVDRDLETICLKCLEKRPEARYASAKALVEDLQRFLQHRPIYARPLGIFQKANRWRRRNPHLATLSASVFAVFLTAFLLVSWSYFRAEEALREEAQQRAAANAARDDAIHHERAERRERYRANMATVAFAFQLTNLAVARNALEAAPEEHRGWEWHHFHHALDGSERVLAGGEGAVQRVRFLENRRLATACLRAVQIWDVATGRLLKTLPNCSLEVDPLLSLSPNGQLLAYPGESNSVQLYDLAADRLRATLRGCAKPVSTIEFILGGKQIVACTSEPKAHVWDTDSGKELRNWPLADKLRAPADIRASGRYIVISAFPDGVAWTWDAVTARKLAVLRSHKASVVSAAFDPQGTRIVTAEMYPSNAIRLWDLKTGTQLKVLRGHKNQARVAFSPDGRRIASSSLDQTVRLWDGMTGAPIAVLQGHAGSVIRIAFSPDGKRLVSASEDQTLRLWDADTGAPINVLCGHSQEVLHVAFSPDGKYIASGAADGTARVWDVRAAECSGILRGHTSFVYGIAFHPDGQRVASASWDGTVRIWDPTTGAEQVQLRYPEKTIVTSVAFHPSGRWLATVGRDNAVRLWDWAKGKELHHWSIPTAFWRDTRLAFSPNGEWLAAGSKDGRVRLWDVRSRAVVAVFQGHKEMVHDIVFGPEGRWLASTGSRADPRIRIWNLARQEQIQVLQGHTDGVYALAVRRDGKMLASGSFDGTVRLWDTQTWKMVAVLKHGNNVYGVAFNADGTRLATACADKTIHFWDVATHQEVAELHGHTAYVHALAFSPDGSRLASASGDFTVRVWDTLTARARAEREGRERKTAH